MAASSTIDLRENNWRRRGPFIPAALRRNPLPCRPFIAEFLRAYCTTPLASLFYWAGIGLCNNFQCIPHAVPRAQTTIASNNLTTPDGGCVRRGRGRSNF